MLSIREPPGFAHGIIWRTLRLIVELPQVFEDWYGEIDPALSVLLYSVWAG